MITLTSQAAAELSRMLEKKGVPHSGLRLAIERGGCAGLQYAMRINEAQPGDIVIDHPSGARLFVAADSVDFLRGSEIDYSDALSDAGFKIHNPNAARSCGCGTSFEPAREAPADLPEGQPCAS
jgi:iron-sulfur cluster assembly accessory protein